MAEGVVSNAGTRSVFKPEDRDWDGLQSLCHGRDFRSGQRWNRATDEHWTFESGSGIGFWLDHLADFNFIGDAENGRFCAKNNLSKINVKCSTLRFLLVK